MTDLALIDTGPSGPWGWHTRERRGRCMQLAAYAELLHVWGEPGNDSVHREERLRTSHALAIGTLGHVGLAHHYARMQDRQTGHEERWLAPAAAVRMFARHHGLEDYVPEMMPALEMYPRAYAAEEETLEIIAVEKVLSAVIGGRPFTQRADLIVRPRGQDLFAIGDHKWISRITPKWSRQYANDGQFLGYRTLGEETWGPLFGGVFVNVVAYPKQTFHRPRLPDAPSALAQFRDRVKDNDDYWDRLVDEVKVGKRDPWEFPRPMSELVCEHRYGNCEALELCRYGVEGLVRLNIGRGK